MYIESMPRREETPNFRVHPQILLPLAEILLPEKAGFVHSNLIQPDTKGDLWLLADAIVHDDSMYEHILEEADGQISRIYRLPDGTFAVDDSGYEITTKAQMNQRFTRGAADPTDKTTPLLKVSMWAGNSLEWLQVQEDIMHKYGVIIPASEAELAHIS